VASPSLQQYHFSSSKLHQESLPLGDAGERIEDGRHRGAVASENSICSRIGIDLMKAGGNAADAVCVIPFD
jgi:gamma-glutamyltranspeptidase